MSTTDFLTHCQSLADELHRQSGGGAPQGAPAADPGAPPQSDADSLIGLFQVFRPDGTSLERLFEGLADQNLAESLSDRMQDVYRLAGDDRRPAGGRDAFFIVRKPAPLTVEAAEHFATDWMKGLSQIAAAVGDDITASKLSEIPRIRVLEGAAPKNPKQESEQSELLKVLRTRSAAMLATLPDVDPHAELLRGAYYFISCDATLRDYLMWPFYAKQTGLSDPLRGYFHLWSHGVKYRAFGEEQVDLYLPRDHG